MTAVKNFNRDMCHQLLVASVIADLIGQILSNFKKDHHNLGQDLGLFVHKIDENVSEDVIAWGAAHDVNITRIDQGQFFVSF